MKRGNPNFPASIFALLLVEGGDEVRLCEALLPASRARPHCFWKADGRDFVMPASLAARDPNWRYVSHVGVVLDAEEDPAGTLALAHAALKELGATVTPAHSELAPGQPVMGVFVLPDGVSPGSGERLLRLAAADQELARCANAFEQCAAAGGTAANRDKSWIQSYLAHSEDGGLRVHDALHDASWFDSSHEAFSPLRTFLARLVS